MIVKTLPQLIQSGKTINRPNLYEMYLLGELKRQKIMKKRTLILSEGVRFSLLQHLAIDFYDREMLSINFSDASRYIEKYVNPPKPEVEAYTRDFLTTSFLIREGDEYQFSHRSIMEYLYAKFLINEINRNQSSTFKKQPLELVVAEFLSELEPNRDTLWAWIESTKTRDNEEPKYLGGNSATLLCKIDPSFFSHKDLSNTNLTTADFSNCNLLGANFNRTLLKDCSLINAQFLKIELASSRLIDCVFSLILLAESVKEETLVFQDFDELIGKLQMELSKVDVSPGGFKFYHQKGHIISTTIFMVPDFRHLQKVIDIFRSHSEVKFCALYHDDYKELRELIPSSLKDRYTELCHDFIV